MSWRSRVPLPCGYASYSHATHHAFASYCQGLEPASRVMTAYWRPSGILVLCESSSRAAAGGLERMIGEKHDGD